jgi:hypothetical protein
MVSNFQVEFGKDANGNRTLQTVPVYYGDPSRQVSVILKGNSENTLNSVPAMAVYISSLTYDRDRVQNPYHESAMRVREQVYNAVTHEYTGVQDGQYTVERMMPAPYKLGVKLDIWTSNTDQKHQLIEQLTPLFNPGFEIQSTDNYIDWTSLSVALLNSVTYSSRSVPSGADESIDIATLEFELPIWISLPAKVKKGGVVACVIANIYDQQGDFHNDIIETAATSQWRYTPMNYEVVYLGNTLTLYQAVNADSGGVTAKWHDLVNMYGRLTNGISQIRLEFDYPDGPHEIVGTVAYNPSDDTQMLFTADTQTLPANTLNSVNAIIDPQNVTVDSHIVSPAAGTRYIILGAIGAVGSESAAAWVGDGSHTLVANANDIIEWNGSYWTVAFDSQTESTAQYVTNLNTTTQYRWDGSQWLKSYEGVYRAGYWSIVL